MNLEEHLIALEWELLQPGTRKDHARVSALLAEDFREFGSSGRIFTRQTILEALAEETPAEIFMAESAVGMLSATAALLTYHASRTGGSASLRSSLWVLQEEGWRMVFHQGTKLS